MATFSSKNNMHLEFDPNADNNIFLSLFCWALVVASYFTTANLQVLAIALACLASISTIVLNVYKLYKSRKNGNPN